MSEEDYQRLLELARQERQREVTKEEAIRRLARVGILDENGDYTEDFKWLEEYGSLPTPTLLQ